MMLFLANRAPAVLAVGARVPIAIVVRHDTKTPLPPRDDAEHFNRRSAGYLPGLVGVEILAVAPEGVSRAAWRCAAS